MSTTLTIEVPVHFHRIGHGSRKVLHPGAHTPAPPPGRVPRVSRLMALALRFDEMVRTKQVVSYSRRATGPSSKVCSVRSGVTGVVEDAGVGPGEPDALVELADREQSGVAGPSAQGWLDYEKRAKKIEDLWPRGW